MCLLLLLLLLFFKPTSTDVFAQRYAGLSGRAKNKRENNIGEILCKVHVWKWPVVKDTHIKIEPRICVLFVFDLNDKHKLVKNKTLKHYSDLRSMFLVDTLVGRIGGDSVSVLIYCPQSTGV